MVLMASDFHPLLEFAGQQRKHILSSNVAGHPGLPAKHRAGALATDPTVPFFSCLGIAGRSFVGKAIGVRAVDLSHGFGSWRVTDGNRTQPAMYETFAGEPAAILIRPCWQC